MHDIEMKVNDETLNDHGHFKHETEQKRLGQYVRDPRLNDKEYLEDILSSRICKKTNEYL